MTEMFAHASSFSVMLEKTDLGADEMPFRKKEGPGGKIRSAALLVMAAQKSKRERNSTGPSQEPIEFPASMEQGADERLNDIVTMKDVEMTAAAAAIARTPRVQTIPPHLPGDAEEGAIGRGMDSFDFIDEGPSELRSENSEVTQQHGADLRHARSTAI